MNKKSWAKDAGDASLDAMARFRAAEEEVETARLLARSGVVLPWKDTPSLLDRIEAQMRAVGEHLREAVAFCEGARPRRGHTGGLAAA